MSPTLWLFGSFTLFGGWAFLSLLGNERQRRVNEILSKQPPASAEAKKSH